MNMVIGGACQGKRACAKALYPGKTWLDGAVCDREEIFTCEGIYHLEEYIRREMKAGEAMEDFAERLIQKNPELVIVCNEIGYGLVPIDAFERKFREQTGRICTKLAAFSKRVDRVVCGIANTIKGGKGNEC